MLNKDVTHPAMRRKIENPRILLLDCSLEYQKGESQVGPGHSEEHCYLRSANTSASVAIHRRRVVVSAACLSLQSLLFSTQVGIKNRLVPFVNCGSP